MEEHRVAPEYLNWIEFPLGGDCRSMIIELNSFGIDMSYLGKERLSK